MLKTKSAEEWLKLYAQSHKNPKNIQIHKIAVPIIYWSFFAMLWGFIAPQAAWLFILLALGFYMTVGLNHFMEMAIVSMLAVGGFMVVEAFGPPLKWTALVLFIAGWGAQFYGHKLEGKAPAFKDNLIFMLIGPLWCLQSLKGKKS